MEMQQAAQGLVGGWVPGPGPCWHPASPCWQAGPALPQVPALHTRPAPPAGVPSKGPRATAAPLRRPPPAIATRCVCVSLSVCVCVCVYWRRARLSTGGSRVAVPSPGPGPGPTPGCFGEPRGLPAPGRQPPGSERGSGGGGRRGMRRGGRR